MNKVYQNVYAKDFDVEKFITDHEAEIDSVPLDKAEHAILKDKFSSKYDREKKYTPEECCICLCEFDESGLMLDYPNCKHSFHFECIIKWFEQKMNCPYCKAPIRASILRAIVNKN